jgi:hypothetical protein
MNETATIHRRVYFHAAGRRSVLQEGPRAPGTAHLPGRIPRVARLMALAIHLERLVHSGQIPDYATLANLGHVTRARITQISNLTLLAPDIQEAILFLPRVQRGGDPIVERDLRPIVARADWQRQRQMWSRLRRSSFCQPSAPGGAPSAHRGRAQLGGAT